MVTWIRIRVRVISRIQIRGIHNTGLMSTERVVLSAYVCSVLLTLD